MSEKEFVVKLQEEVIPEELVEMLECEEATYVIGAIWLFNPNYDLV